MINYRGDDYEILCFSKRKNGTEEFYMEYWLCKNGIQIHPVSEKETENVDATILKFFLERSKMDMAAEYERIMVPKGRNVGNYLLEPVREGEEKPLYTLSYPPREFINLDTSSNAFMGEKKDDGTEKSGYVPIIAWTLAAILFFTALIYFLSK